MPARALIITGFLLIIFSFPRTAGAQLYIPWLHSRVSSSSSASSKVIAPRRVAVQIPETKKSSSSSSSSSFDYSAFMADVRAAKKFEPSETFSASSSSSGIKDPSRVTGGSCPNRTFLSIFDAYLTCGDGGYVFPDLISGGCPVTACILKNRKASDVWGKALDF